MPYIKTTTNKEIPESQRENLIKKLGEAIALIPGKSDAWLMLAFEDEIPMSFKSKADSDYAFVEVAIFGSASDSAYDRLTEAICEIINEEIEIPKSNIYVKYEESEHWGWNGRNF